MDRKLGALPLFGEGETGSPSNTIWPGPSVHAKFHLDPSNHLATANQSQTGEDRRDRQRSNSIGQTVLQMVAQKALSLNWPF